MIVKFVKYRPGRRIPFRQIQGVVGGKSGPVQLPQLLQAVSLPQIIGVAHLRGHLPAVSALSKIRRTFREIPEVLPGDKTSTEVLVGRGPLVQALHIVQPGQPHILVVQQSLKTVQNIVPAVVIPGVAHPQHNAQILRRCRLHHTVQFVPRIGVVCDGIRPRLELPPGNHQNNAVETVLRDLSQLRVHVFALTIPEIDHPVVGIISGGFQISRRARRVLRRPGKAGRKGKCRQSQRCGDHPYLEPFHMLSLCIF